MFCRRINNFRCLLLWRAMLAIRCWAKMAQHKSMHRKKAQPQRLWNNWKLVRKTGHGACPHSAGWTFRWICEASRAVVQQADWEPDWWLTSVLRFARDRSYCYRKPDCLHASLHRIWCLRVKGNWMLKRCMVKRFMVCCSWQEKNQSLPSVGVYYFRPRKSKTPDSLLHDPSEQRPSLRLKCVPKPPCNWRKSPKRSSGNGHPLKGVSNMRASTDAARRRLHPAKKAALVRQPETFVRRSRAVILP